MQQWACGGGGMADVTESRWVGMVYFWIWSSMVKFSGLGHQHAALQMPWQMSQRWSR